jgi:hypothetical protein
MPETPADHGSRHFCNGIPRYWNAEKSYTLMQSPYPPNGWLKGRGLPTIWRASRSLFNYFVGCAMKSEILIFKSRNLLLQRVSDQVVHGYSHYCSGTVSIERCQNLVRKFDLNYQVLADRNLRARRKSNDLGNASLLLYYDNAVIHWWMMVTDPQSGEHLAHHRESLLNAMTKEGRCQINGCELVKLPKKGAEGTKMTWRMTAKKYEDWRLFIIDSVRKASSNALHNMIYQLWSSPGFSGVRTQIGHLTAHYRAEVKRASRKDAPQTPKRLPYVRRMQTQGITLTQLVWETKAKNSQGSDACDVSKNAGHKPDVTKI